MGNGAENNKQKRGTVYNATYGKRQKKLGFKSLQAKILILIGLPVIIAFLIAGNLSMNSARATVYDLTNNELAIESQKAALQIDGYFQTFARITTDMAGNRQFQQIMEDTPKGTAITSAENFQQTMDTLVNISRTDEAILALWLADVDSSQLWASDGFISDRDWDIEQRGWYRSVTTAGKTGQAVFTEPYWDDTVNLNVITLVMPIFEENTDNLIGVAGADIALEHLSEIIQSYTLGEKGFYIPVSASGQILYHPDENYLNKAAAETDLSDNLKKAVAEKTPGNLQYTSHGESNHGYVASVGDTGWLVISGLPDGEFEAPISAMRTTMITIFIAAELLIGILIIVFSRSMVRPLRKLTDVARQIAQGNLNAEISVSSADETGQVSAAIKEAVDHIRNYISEITRVLRSMGQGDMCIELELVIESIVKIKMASSEQAGAINQIRQGLAQVSAVVQTNAATAEENSATGEEISAQAAALREEVGKFKLRSKYERDRNESVFLLNN